MSDDGIYIKRLIYNRMHYCQPSVDEVRCIASNRGMAWIHDGYFGTLYRLMLAGFCVLLCCTASFSDDIFKPTGRFAVVKQSLTVQSAPQWYLVSEPYCVHCPAVGEKFLAKGWPAKNIITIAEAKARFGITVDRIPYEFQEPVKQPKPVTRTSSEIDAENHLRTEHGITVSGLTLEQMEIIHDKAHGGSAYHFPGRASMPTSQPVSRVVSGCPGGVCPTSQSVRVSNRGVRRFVFWRR